MSGTVTTDYNSPPSRESILYQMGESPVQRLTPPAPKVFRAADGTCVEDQDVTP